MYRSIKITIDYWLFYFSVVNLTNWNADVEAFSTAILLKTREKFEFFQTF